MSVLWILGAADAEMTAIESLLRDCGQTVLYAAVPTDTMYRRVAPGERASHVLDRLPDSPFLVVVPTPTADVVAIEVAGPWGQPAIDHHDDAERASWGPERFLQASSLGQVIERLAQMDVLPGSWREDVIGAYSPAGQIDSDGQGYLVWGGLTGEHADGGGLGEFAIERMWRIPTALVMEAAADHCPAAAVAGLCPGVDPRSFSLFLAESKRRQYFPAMSPDDFARELATSRATLLAAPEVEGMPYVRDLRHLEPGDVAAQGSGECYPAKFLVGIVAALFEGLGFICHIRRRDGKLALRSNGHGQGTLAGTRPAELFLSDPAAFGCGPRLPPGQDASYGNPIRGYFGGTLRGDL